MPDGLGLRLTDTRRQNNIVSTLLPCFFVATTSFWRVLPVDTVCLSNNYVPTFYFNFRFKRFAYVFLEFDKANILFLSPHLYTRKCHSLRFRKIESDMKTKYIKNKIKQIKNEVEHFLTNTPQVKNMRRRTHTHTYIISVESH